MHIHPSSPIGVFDSGVGGLTVAAALMQRLPSENIISFGDTARVPYGIKSVATITQYAKQIAEFLLQQQVKLLIIACNTMAAVAPRVNAQHAQGSDLNGTQGGDSFVPFTPGAGGSVTGAARAMSVAISDSAKIAGAALGSGPDSNANARLLAGIQDEKLFESGSATANKFYSHLIYSVGADLQAADEGQTTQSHVLAQLRNQRDSISGVNLDEEAVNIIRYQKAYEASARLVQVWNTLAEEVINLLGTA